MTKIPYTGAPMTTAPGWVLRGARELNDGKIPSGIVVQGVSGPAGNIEDASDLDSYAGVLIEVHPSLKTGWVWKPC